MSISIPSSNDAPGGDACDVLVLGAGVAGLAAARALSQAGKKVVVIEARERIGGRIHTVHAAGDTDIAIELGAEFIHGLPPATWSVVREAQLATSELGGSQLRYSTAGGLGAGDANDPFDVLRRLADDPHAGMPSDESFFHYVRANIHDSQSRAAAIAYVEGFNAADATRIGVRALVRQQRAEDAIDADRLFHLTAGYDRLPAFLAQCLAARGGTVCLGAPVSQVTWQSGTVTMHGDRAGRSFARSGRRAIITLPLGVLKARSVTFAPSPIDILVQADRMAMGAVVRTTLHFKERFWASLPWTRHAEALRTELDELSFLFTSSTLPGTWWTPHPEPHATLTAWVGGPRAAGWQAGLAGPHFVHRLGTHCLRALAEIFCMPLQELERHFIRAHAHDWIADRYSLGAYSYAPAGADDASEKLSRPVDGTLFFAGEHTDTSGHWGTVHGALGSGARAADQVLRSFAV